MIYLWGLVILFLSKIGSFYSFGLVADILVGSNLLGNSGRVIGETGPSIVFFFLNYTVLKEL